MFTECDPRPEPVDIARASGVIDKTFTKGFGSGSRASPAFPGTFSSLSRVAIKSRAMAKNAKPSKILTKLPMIGYAVFNNKPLSASSRCLLMKDKAPIETKPAPKTKSPALVDSFSKSRGVFMFESGHALIGAGPCYPVKYWSRSPIFRGGCSPIILVGSATTCSWPLEE